MLASLTVVAALLVTSASAGAPSAPAGVNEPDHLRWAVVSRRPHDTEAYTQGLVLDGQGRLFESTGKRGRSSMRQVDAYTGAVLRSNVLPDELFGEGLALVGDRFIQLTWENEVALAWDAETFEQVATVPYEGEGWGLCFDGERLVMSDGSDALAFRDSRTFEIVGSVSVTLAGEPLDGLNELECVDGAVWANVYRTDRIVRIDPTDGRVTGVLDLAGILDPHPAEARAGSVLNGIAYDPEVGTFLVTGKQWPELIEIRVFDNGPEAAV